MNCASSASTIILTRDIYSRAAIDQAVQDFADRLNVIISKEGDHGVAIDIVSPTGGARDDQILREFLNCVLEISIRACDAERSPSHHAEAIPRP